MAPAPFLLTVVVCLVVYHVQGARHMPHERTTQGHVNLHNEHNVEALPSSRHLTLASGASLSHTYNAAEQTKNSAHIKSIVLSNPSGNDDLRDETSTQHFSQQKEEMRAKVSAYIAQHYSAAAKEDIGADYDLFYDLLYPLFTLPIEDSHTYNAAKQIKVAAHVNNLGLNLPSGNDDLRDETQQSLQQQEEMRAKVSAYMAQHFAEVEEDVEVDYDLFYDLLYPLFTQFKNRDGL